LTIEVTPESEPRLSVRQPSEHEQLESIRKAARECFRTCQVIAAGAMVPATHRHFEGRMHAWSEVLMMLGETAECTCPTCVYTRGMKGR
jgi:hypothetical protein